MYVINYDIKDVDRCLDFVSRLKEFGLTELFLPNAMFLASDEEYSKIYDRLKEGLNAVDLFFITKIHPTERDGWLNDKTVNWFNKYENSNTTRNEGSGNVY